MYIGSPNICAVTVVLDGEAANVLCFAWVYVKGRIWTKETLIKAKFSSFDFC